MAKAGLVRLIEPALEPVSLAEAKLHVSQDLAADDDLIAMKIVESREKLEVDCMRALVTQTWRLSIDGFYSPNLLPRPGVMLSSLAGGLAGWADAWRVWQERGGGWGTSDISTIRCPFAPLQSVGSITYVDSNGVTQTLASSFYQVDTDQEPGRILPSFGNVWPTTQSQANAVQIVYTAGWPHTTVAAPIPSGTQTVTPATMSGILAGQSLRVDVGAAQEVVTVLSVTGTTFTATFAAAHPAGVVVSRVPVVAKQAILLLVGHAYRFRGDDGRAADQAIPPGYEALVSRLTTGEY